MGHHLCSSSARKCVMHIFLIAILVTIALLLFFRAFFQQWRTNDIVDIKEEVWWSTPPRALVPHVLQGDKIANLFLHIPKTGGHYVRLKLEAFAADALPTTGSFHEVYSTWKKRHSQGREFTACEGGMKPWPKLLELARLHNNTYPYKSSKHSPKRNNTVCTIWSSEAEYNHPQHNATNRLRFMYTIVREPRAHVLSQYFHCMESPDHRTHAHDMPNLTDWLQAWALAVKDTKKRTENTRFHCYKPINLQSETIGYGSQRPNQQQQYQMLRQRFLVVGDVVQMDLSVCVIFMEWTDQVPGPCNCSSSSNTSTAVARLSNDSRRGNDHGVKHHGSSFKTTRYQDGLIRELTWMDGKLYEDAKGYLKDKVAELERRYQVRLCFQS